MAKGRGRRNERGIKEKRKQRQMRAVGEGNHDRPGELLWTQQQGAGPWMPRGWTDRADISAGPGVIHNGGDSAALGDDILPPQVMFLGAERNPSPSSASLESSGHLFSLLWMETGKWTSCGLIGVICVCSLMSKSPQSPSSPEPS